MTRKHSNYFRLIALALAFAVVLYYSYRTLEQQAYAELELESSSLLTLFSSNLAGELSRYEYLPELISRNVFLQNALLEATEQSQFLANHYLQEVAHSSGAAAVYLMDMDGLTIASSNFLLEHSFVGRNFSFRPYFKQAASGVKGRYFAIGTTSLKRGFYYSYPVRIQNVQHGVAVVKINLNELEAAWSERGHQFIVTDEDGIIFLTTEPAWKFTAIRPITDRRLGEIHASRRYANNRIKPLKLAEAPSPFNDLTIVNISTGDENPATYLWQSVHSIDAGWEIHALANVKRIHGSLRQRTTIAVLALLTLFLLAALYLTNRQRSLILQESATLLESRVEERTIALRIENEERKKAEQNLRETQAELIQAEKMAGLGEISASIGHELNQPLTAMRTYSDTAQRMLKLSQSDAVANNLKEISDLTNKMSRTISLLRGFSRKSAGEQTRLSLDDAIDQALNIFISQLQQNSLTVEKEIPKQISVVTDAVLLNQVLVNLISNAIHATQSPEGQHEKTLKFDARQTETTVVIGVSDSGTGIPEEVIHNIFDPFFTTKEMGLGLGLGLSITYRIVENLGGKISARNQPHSGARFEIELPIDGEA